MRKSVAWVLLILLLLGLAHSTYSMFMGRLMQGLYILPLLMVVYVWTVGRKGSEDVQDETESEHPPQDKDS